MPHQFKVWDKKKKRMVGQQWMLPNPDNRFEVLIFTGAKDKDGVDIAYKDIVKWGRSEFVIDFNDISLCWQLELISQNITGKVFDQLNSINAREMKVIGSILQQEVDNEGEKI